MHVVTLRLIARTCLVPCSIFMHSNPLQALPSLGSALDFILSSINRSASSPPAPVMVTEWGAPLQEWSAADALAAAKNVVGEYLAVGVFGCLCI